MKARDLLAWNVSELRVERGLSQEKLAVDAGIDRAYFGSIERNAENPTLEIVDRLAGALDVPVERLFKMPKSPDAPRPRLPVGRPRKDATRS